MINNTVTIVLESNQKYIKLLVACLVSILYNKKPTTKIDIHIFDAGIGDYHKSKVKQLETFNKINNCSISFIDAESLIPKLDTNVKEINLRYGFAPLRKLVVPSLFNHLDRVLYLDVDTIVRGDLLDFFNQDFEDNYCVCLKGTFNFKALESYFNTLVVDYNNKICTNYDLLIEMGLTKEMLNSDDKYNVNGGVILYNNKQINQENKADVLINLGLKYGVYLLSIDENTISATFKNHIKAMEEKYNYFVHYINNDNKNLTFKSAIIYHYPGSLKPSKLNKLFKINKYSYREFYKYLQMSYLKINPLKLKIAFLWANIKRIRLKLFSTVIVDNKKVFCFLGFTITIKKLSN